MAESKSQKRANARWHKNNRKKSNFYSDKSKAKKFARCEASINDARELINILKKRLNKLLNK